MVRTILKIVVALLIAHALYQFLPAYIRYHLFKDDVKQAALFGGGASPKDLVDQVMLHAEARGVPLERANVWVHKQDILTFIETAYEEPIQVLPWYTYTWNVEVAAGTVPMTPPRDGR